MSSPAALPSTSPRAADGLRPPRIHPFLPAFFALALFLTGCGSDAPDQPEDRARATGREEGLGGSLAPDGNDDLPPGPPADEVDGGSMAEMPGEEEARAEERLGPEELRERLAHLKALPYVSYDPNADESLVGVTRQDPARVSPGYNLYTNEATRISMLDNGGDVVHRWHVPHPFRKCEHARLLDDGTLLVVCVDMGLVALDWDSQLLWDHKANVHHDVDLRPDGTIVIPAHSREPYKEREVWFADLLHLSSNGQVLGRWSTLEHLDELKAHHPPSPLDTPPGPGDDALKRSLTGLDYYHMNSVDVLPETPLGARDGRFRAGNILVSLRNVNLVLILDRDDHSILWSWGPGEIELQHMPTMVPSGNILIFDNGTYRGWSRVIEVEPVSGRIVWEYKGDPPQSFHTKWRGSSQRLPNGNTLICESERGHVVEVTRDLEVVWEFWNPDLRFGARKRIYRFIREPAEKVERILKLESVR